MQAAKTIGIGNEKCYRPKCVDGAMTGVCGTKPMRRRRRRPYQRTYRNSWFAELAEFARMDQEDRRYLAELSIEQILAWADAYHQRTGRSPTCRSGAIPEAPGEENRKSVT